ncbi:hypothetical protein FSARC_578 [Fusarium sarcochroum]|uniref:Uncharacterized protein n=1 Tax=Fusarium sarcochroum TaxID=1208366 RepID=A0A8H4UB33_9HYPO|nr:hypothetical protein FSARC_578 [Fusarium sarcochroum]
MFGPCSPDSSNDAICPSQAAIWSNGISEIKCISTGRSPRFNGILAEMERSAGEPATSAQAIFDLGWEILCGDYSVLPQEQEEERREIFDIWVTLAPLVVNHHDVLVYLLKGAEMGMGGLINAPDLAHMDGVSLPIVRHQFEVESWDLDSLVPTLITQFCHVLALQPSNRAYGSARDSTDDLPNQLFEILKDYYGWNWPSSEKALAALTALLWGGWDRFQKEESHPLEDGCLAKVKEVQCMDEESIRKWCHDRIHDAVQKGNILYRIALDSMGEQLPSIPSTTLAGMCLDISEHTNRTIDQLHSGQDVTGQHFLPTINETMLRDSSVDSEHPFGLYHSICKFVQQHSLIAKPDSGRECVDISIDQATIFGRGLVKAVAGGASTILPSHGEAIIKTQSKPTSWTERLRWLTDAFATWRTLDHMLPCIEFSDSLHCKPTIHLNMKPEHRQWLCSALAVWRAVDYLQDQCFKITHDSSAPQDDVAKILPTLEVLRGHIILFLFQGDIATYKKKSAESHSNPPSSLDEEFHGNWNARDTRSRLVRAMVCWSTQGAL